MIVRFEHYLAAGQTRFLVVFLTFPLLPRFSRKGILVIPYKGACLKACLSEVDQGARLFRQYCPHCE